MQLSKGNFKEKEKSVTGLRWAPDTKTDWPTDCRSQISFNFNFNQNQYSRRIVYLRLQRTSILVPSLIYVDNGLEYSTHHSATVSKESPALSKISVDRPGSAPANSRRSAGRPHRGVNIRTEGASYVGARINSLPAPTPHNDDI
jgi:hypothetical protein